MSDDLPDLGARLRRAASSGAPLALEPAAARGHGEARRRRARLASAAGAVVLVGAAVVGGTALTGPSSDRESLRPAGPTPTVTAPVDPTATPSPLTSPAPSPSTTVPPPPPPVASTPPSPTAGPTPRQVPPTAVPTSAPTVLPVPPAAPPALPPGPPAQVLELRGDDLGATRIGQPRAEAIAAVSALLGPADESSPFVRCLQAFSEVEWGQDLRLAFDGEGRVSGWLVRSPRLATPSGVRVGTTVAQLRQTYGDRLQLYPPNPDGGDSYTVTGVAMLGGLDGSADSSRVVSLSNGACNGP